MLFSLDPDLAPGGSLDGPIAEQFRMAHAADFSQEVCAALVLRADTPLQFRTALAEAKSIRSIARVCAAQIEGVDHVAASDHAITNGIPHEQVRLDIATLRATISQDMHIDTTRPVGAASTAAIYAHRRAEADATRSRK